MKNFGKITAIEIENFQTIEEKTRIELAPITLLYGPNSAGKSSVFDAIQFAQAFWAQENRDIQHIERLFDRWARRTSETRHAHQREMKIAVEFKQSFDWFESFLLFAPSLFPESENDKRTDLFLRHSKVKEASQKVSDLPIKLEVSLLGIDDEYGSLQHLFMTSHSVYIEGSPFIQAIGGYESTRAFNFNEMAHIRGELDLVLMLYSRAPYSEIFRTDELISIWGQQETESIDDIADVRRFFTHPIDQFDEDGVQGFFDSMPSDPSDVPDQSLSRDDVAPVSLLRISKETSVYCRRLSSDCSPYGFISRQAPEKTRSLVEGINKVLQQFGAGVCEIFDNSTNPIVSGSRQVPEQKALRFDVDLTKESSMADPNFFVHKLASWGLCKALNDHYASSGEKESDFLEFGRLTADLSEFDRDYLYTGELTVGERLLQQVKQVQNGARRFESINEVLGGALFQTSFYQVVAESEVSIPIRNLGASSRISADQFMCLWSSSSVVGTVGCKAKVKLDLIDYEAQSVQLNDVGSGIGYFLPCAISVESDGLSQLQQPELHLHPALQGNVADVFVGAIEKNSQILCETHSEHLLLRLLRRIRSSGSNLSHNDVAVYYFDPVASDDPTKLQGPTVVSRLQVGSDGEFVTRWPKGFFEERWQDLHHD